MEEELKTIAERMTELESSAKSNNKKCKYFLLGDKEIEAVIELSRGEDKLEDEIIEPDYSKLSEWLYNDIPVYCVRAETFLALVTDDVA